MSNWLKRMMNLIFEDEDVSEGENNKAAKSYPERKQNRKSIGRMTSGNNSFEPKMMHQYPKEGNFRFPVIPDEKAKRQNDVTRQQPKSSEPRNYTQNRIDERKAREPEKREPKRDRNTQRRSEVKERPKFTGNFTPTDIPSPIYGFGKRPEVFPPEIGPDSSFSISSGKAEMNQTYEPGYEAFQAISEMTEDPTVIPETEGEQVQKDARILGWDFKREIEAQDEQIQQESDKSPEIMEDQFYEDESLATHHTEFEKDYQSEASYLGDPSEIEDSVEADPNPDTYQNHDSQATNIPESKNSDRSQKPSTRKENNEHDTRKSPIPFNVMMLQRDRNVRTGTNNDFKPKEPIPSGYEFPSERLLDREIQEPNNDDTWLEDQIELLQSTLHNFNVSATVVGATQGPSVTRIEVQPAPGVKVNKITNLSDDIKLSLSAKDIRMEAPIPGRNAIGIEVPNKVSKPVTLREIITHPNFSQSSSPLSVALGLDISGNPVVTDLQKMPHGLIAGATGSGKSVCINSLLISILYKAHPDDVRLMLIDPKMVELAPYNQLPHLVTPVITDAKEATLGLKWAVDEMERRYELFAKTGVRDMERFNKLVKEKGDPDQKLPYVVVVIDELADLMMVSPQDVEDSICRIAQKARACGIHLLLATQRPSVDVITGLIKANVPTRIAFSVSSSVDSRTIIDTNGADKLLGKGDMLFLGNGVSKPVRVQGNFVSDEEIERITAHVKRQRDPDYLFEKEELVQNTMAFEQNDELFEEACEFVLEQGAASSSSLQRRFRIGYNRAARLVDMMESRGIVSEAMGSKPRSVPVTKQEFQEQSSE